MKPVTLFFTAIIPTLLPAAAFGAPQVGDKAPKVKVEKWLTTAPPALPGEKDADKHIFLVEFWATWCGPCRQSMPHLAELHHRHTKDGLVVLGISNEDAETIGKFVKKGKGSKQMDMPYPVGADEKMGTNKGWMEGIAGIPHAFLVDKTNTIVWSGHPMDDALEESLALVLSGKFDVQTAKKAAEANKKFSEAMKQFGQAYDEKEEKKLFDLLDQMIALKPAEAKPYLMKRHLLKEFQRDDEISALEKKIEEAMKDSKPGLHDVVEVQLELPLAERNAGMLLRCAKRANDLAEGKDPEILSLLARVQCEMGMVDAAIATQERAVGLATDDVREDLKKVLAYYKEVKGLVASAKS